MNLKDIVIKGMELDETFNFKRLYNDYSRGAVFKEEYKSLIKEAICKKEILVKKYLIGENIQDELLELGEVKGHEYTLLDRLKNYHNESISVVTPFVYILKKLDSEFTIEIKDKKNKSKIKFL